MSDNRSLPPYAEWPSFPFTGELRVKALDPPVEVEPPRHGENPADCRACNAPDEDYIWVNERWRVRSVDHPTGLPVVLILEPRSHLDLGDLPNLLSAELGVMTVRVERAIRSLDGVARVHVNRWGDGPAHLHTWFLARPYGQLQLQGTFLAIWNDLLPPIDEELWLENLALVAAWLGEFGGTALAEPPRIHWTAPSRFSPDSGGGVAAALWAASAATDSAATDSATADSAATAETGTTDTTDTTGTTGTDSATAPAVVPLNGSSPGGQMPDASEAGAGSASRSEAPPAASSVPGGESGVPGDVTTDAADDVAAQRGAETV